MPLTVEAAARTHIGLVRRSNQDAFLLGRHLLAVADGLGGHNAGEIASSSVIDALRPYDRQIETVQLMDTLGRAVYSASETLQRKIQVQPELAGMGTTLVAMLWSGKMAVLAHIGDSRAYLLRDSGSSSTTSLVQITEDHTCERLLADASSVPGFSGRISRFLDGRPDGRSPDLATWELRADDRFLLCSDGLSSAVRSELIHESLRSSASPENVADSLVALAIKHGGPDNITVVVMDVREATFNQIT
ncbi:protein phosphatase [Sinosporangium album]|uniref:Protein phosphatase n=1 Tax=Sinosporangium album TaxID=504805 RepID=A0A1G8LI19_9ACTN|nr:protein phosphatase 2C domain-containing protein [Sinosporangium album]SDI55087.1 protein phosphatase [Sinosporangium album]